MDDRLPRNPGGMGKGGGYVKGRRVRRPRMGGGERAGVVDDREADEGMECRGAREVDEGAWSSAGKEAKVKGKRKDGQSDEKGKGTMERVGVLRPARQPGASADRRLREVKGKMW